EVAREASREALEVAGRAEPARHRESRLARRRRRRTARAVHAASGGSLLNPSASAAPLMTERAMFINSSVRALSARSAASAACANRPAPRRSASPAVTARADRLAVRGITLSPMVDLAPEALDSANDRECGPGEPLRRLRVALAFGLPREGLRQVQRLVGGQQQHL